MHPQFRNSNESPDTYVSTYIPLTVGFSVKRDTKAVVIVTPAEGPSLLIAPSGKWMCTSTLFIRLLLASLSILSCNDTMHDTIVQK